jgi:hypothetical protein
MNPFNLSFQSIADAGLNLDLSDRDSLQDRVASVSSEISRNSFSAIADKFQDSGQRANVESSENTKPKTTEFSFHRLENLTLPLFSSLAHSPSDTPDLETSTITTDLNKLHPNSKNNEPDFRYFSRC